MPAEPRLPQREESFYPALAGLLQQVSKATGRIHVHVTTLPTPTEERSDLIEGTDQLQRYRSIFPNLILTNFLEFRRYRNGEHVETVLCGRPVVLNKPGMAPPMSTAGMSPRISQVF